MKNPFFVDKQSPYYNQVKLFLLPMVPDGPNVVLDIGCGAGRFGQKLIELNKAIELVGVEIFEPAAKEAMKSYRVVHTGDIEELYLKYNNYFDVIICGDVLEHMKEPEKLLQRIRTWLKKDGRIICSVPNVRYWRIWRDLIFRGVWDYSEEGILDRTHLRFFTSKSFKKILCDASFVVELEEMRIAVGPKQEIFNKLTFGWFTEFLGFQILISAKKS